MENLLRQISVILFCMYTSACVSQKVKFELSVPLVSYHVNNLSDIDNGFNKRIANLNYIPQFRFTTKARNIVVGFEHYYYSNGSGNPSPKAGELSSMRLESYSLLVGYELYSSKKNSLKLGGGFSYNKPNLGLYIDYYPQPWEAWICYEDNKFGALFWLTISRRFFRHWNIGLNLRYNPMFKEFGVNETSNCGTPHNHDRLNYFVSQLMIGYEF